MRNFSAPVITNYEMSYNDRLFLMTYDSNMFNRWEQSQIIHKNTMVRLYNMLSIEDEQYQEYINVLVNIVTDDKIESNLKVALLNLPNQEEIMSDIVDCDPIRLYEHVTRKIYCDVSLKAKEYLVSKTDEFMSFSMKYTLIGKQISSRELFGTLLKLRFAEFDEPLCFTQKLKTFFLNSDNLTDKVSIINALSSAKDYTCEVSNILSELLDTMASQYNGDVLMTTKLLKYVSQVLSPNTVITLSELYDGLHPRSNMVCKNTPNHMYSLVRAFTNNPYVHQIVSSSNNMKQYAPGYEYITKCILDIDKHNGIVSSRIAGVFEIINNLSPEHRKLMQVCIDRIKSTNNLSENISEILH
jgi:aminopeptidase N